MYTILHHQKNIYILSVLMFSIVIFEYMIYFRDRVSSCYTLILLQKGGHILITKHREKKVGIKSSSNIFTCSTTL